MKKLKTLVCTVALTALPFAAQAQQLRYASGFPPGGPVNDGLRVFAEALAAGSDMSMRLFEMSLLNLNETPPGIRDGVADMGYVLMPYYPAEYAEPNLAADLSMLATIGAPGAVPALAMAGALSEYAMLHCPDCQSGFARENQVYLGSASTPDYVLLCTSPMTEVEQLRGRTFRAGAENWGRWAEHFGGIKVSIPGNEIYEAMSQGVVDCAMISAPELTNLQLIDVTRHITVGVPGGVFAGSGAANMNRDTWAEMDVENRAFLLRAAADNVAEITIRYNNAAQEALSAAEARGIAISEASPALMEASARFVEEDVAVIARQFSDSYGVQGVDDKIVIIRDLITRWGELAAGLEQDPEAFGALLWDEVFSRVDPAQYGLN
ncbi:C4-dicarboxylate TRAP transporter substrate-binding protein [Pararhodobacter sp.]|uniref:C4-dicarboxylate TRAP transporter substrate-binding protein n=1 Tax=Pararhodobacter sp. TaxID=2127056 RepID=UPI002FDE58EA